VKVAVPVTNDYVDGPGEATEVHIYEVNGKEYKLVEKFTNPALQATHARGVYMLKAGLERGVTAFIVAEIGPPGIRFLKGKAKVYLASGMKVDEALDKLVKGELTETDKPTHDDHHHHVEL